jgi:hypothetical protein
MIRTQVSLHPEMYQEAREEASRQGMSFAEFVRRALARALPARPSQHPWARFAGAIDDAGQDGSASVDAVVYGRERP